MSCSRLAPARFGLRAPCAADVDALRRAVGSEAVVADIGRLAACGHDETEDLFCPPDVAVLPESAEQVSAVLRFAYAERLPVVPRGAGLGQPA